MATRRYTNEDDVTKAYEGLTPEQQKGYGGSGNFNTAVMERMGGDNDPNAINQDVAIGGEVMNNRRRYTSPAGSTTPEVIPPAPNAPNPVSAPKVTDAAIEEMRKQGITNQQDQLNYLNKNSGGQQFTAADLPFGTGDAVADSYISTLRDYNPETDEAAIKEKARADMQTTIDAINAKYASIFAQENRLATDRSGQTRAVGARSGLLGSDFGQAQADKTTEYNKSEMRAREAEKAIEMSQADRAWKEAAQAEIQARRSEALGKYNAVQEAQQKALQNLPIIAKAYPNLTPQQKQALMKQTGMDEMTFDAMYNAAKPAEAQIDYEYHTIKNADGSESVIAVGIDPVTGKMVQQSYGDTNVNGQVIKVYDGKPYVETRDENGNISLQLASGFQSKAETPDTKEVNGNLYQYNPETQSWELAIEGGGDGENSKPLSAAEIANFRAQGYDVEPGMTIDDVSYLQRGLSDDERKVAEKDAEVMKENEAKIATLEEKVTLIDGLLNHKGMKGSVGTYGISRWTPFSPDKSARIDFAAGVNQLVSQETVDTLLQLKERGGTLGALSDQERVMLQNAATKIGSWIMRDENGNPTGKFEVSEKDFKAELETMKRLTQTAIENASGGSAPAPLTGGGGGGDELDSLLDGAGFKSAPSTALKGSNVGQLSERFESGGDPGIIGWDSTGGYSFGAYQLTQNNVPGFVQQSKYASEFKGLKPTSTAFQKKWAEVARRDPEGFKQEQKAYIGQTHFDPQMNKLAKAGVDVQEFSPVLQDVIWSTAVQHGPKTDIVQNAIKQAGSNASEADIINKIYDLRWSGGAQFKSSTPEVRQAVKNRFVQERKLALSQLGSRNTA